jgi:hypothetical protein
MKSPKLVRCTPAPQTTEYNDRNGLFSAHDDGKFYLPPDSVPDAIKVGFRVCELTTNEKLMRISDLAADLPEAERIAIQAAISSQQLLVWCALRPDLAPDA